MEFLRKAPLFRDLQAEDLARLAVRMQRRSFAAGVTLFHQDMPGITLYMVEVGKVRVFRISRSGHELTLNIFGPGEILGELSILDGLPHSATAITLSPTVVWLLPRNDLDELLLRHAAVARALLQVVAARVRFTTDHTENLVFHDVQGRLASELLSLAERHGQRTEEGVEIDLPLTQGDLASIVGATRESVNKALTVLRNHNLVRVDGVRVTLVNPHGLLQMVEERGR